HRSILEDVIRHLERLLTGELFHQIVRAGKDPIEQFFSDAAHMLLEVCSVAPLLQDFLKRLDVQRDISDLSFQNSRKSNMTASIQSLTSRPAWKALEAHYRKVRELHLRKLFADDPKRGERMTAEAVGIYLDYSKNRITDETLKLLLQLAEQSGLRARIDA